MAKASSQPSHQSAPFAVEVAKNSEVFASTVQPAPSQPQVSPPAAQATAPVPRAAKSEQLFEKAPQADVNMGLSESDSGMPRRNDTIYKSSADTADL